jgi:hypothetical protein
MIEFFHLYTSGFWTWLGITVFLWIVVILVVGVLEVVMGRLGK